MIAVGWLFVWPFFDKLFGLGYATPSSNAWIHGGSPTKGFLAGVNIGPLQGFFHSLAGQAWADWLSMAGLLGIGIALILGVGLRIAAVTGTVLVVMMWFASWPLARFAGHTPTQSTNPFFDDHLLFALTFIVFVIGNAGDTWGLGRWWASLPLVQRNPWLR
jgi:thiosulfate dehydrogenase [quinone] large subunit